VNPTPTDVFNSAYGNLAASDLSMECTRCGSTLVGDGPAVPVVCVDCLSKFLRGVILRDAVLCWNCAAAEVEKIDWATAVPVTDDSHPDGFTCVCGGDE
jgi:hypothetical protein